MYDVLSVSKCIIQYADWRDYIISYRKLEALLYIIQSEFLKSYDRKFFKEDIICTEYGITIYEVDKKYAIFSLALIPFSDSSPIKSHLELRRNDMDFVYEIIDQYHGYSFSFVFLQILKHHANYKNCIPLQAVPIPVIKSFTLHNT